MARGYVRKRCIICRRQNDSTAKCSHKEAEYHIIYPVEGMRKSEKIGRNKKEAQTVLAHRMTEISNGSYVDLKAITFQAFSERWLDIAFRRLKLSTHIEYRNTIRKHLLPAFGASLITNISPVKIEAFLSGVAKELSPKTVNNILALLKTMLKHAKKWGDIRQNPAEDIERMRVEHKEMDFLDQDEIR